MTGDSTLIRLVFHLVFNTTYIKTLVFLFAGEVTAKCKFKTALYIYMLSRTDDFSLLLNDTRVMCALHFYLQLIPST